MGEGSLDKQPHSPGKPANQAAGNLTSDFSDLSPRDLARDPAGGRTGKHRHQEHKEKRVADQAQQCTGERSNYTPDRNRDGDAPAPAEKLPHALREPDAGGASQEHPEGHHEHGGQAGRNGRR